MSVWGGAVPCEHWLQVECFVPRAHLERDAGRTVLIDDEAPFTQHADAKIDRGVIQRDEVDGNAQRTFELSFDDEARGVKRTRRRFREQHGDVHVAVRPRRASGCGPEDVHGRHLRMEGDNLGDALLQLWDHRRDYSAQQFASAFPQGLDDIISRDTDRKRDLFRLARLRRTTR